MSLFKPPRILLAASHPWLVDALTQILRKASPEVIAAHDLDTFFAQARLNPTVIVVEPFAFNVSGLELLRQLRQEVRAAPIIVLIPTEAGDYRDTVLRLGASGVVAVDCAAIELLPIVKRLIKRGDIGNGLTDQDAQSAGQSTPIGETASRIEPTDCDLKTPSVQTDNPLPARSELDTPAHVDQERD
jgi:DNA-binding NarL/FixJ family response regulator